MKIIKLTIAILSFAVVGMIYGTTFGSTIYSDRPSIWLSSKTVWRSLLGPYSLQHVSARRGHQLIRR